MSNITASPETAVQSTTELAALSRQLAEHPQFKQWSSMHVGPYSLSTQLRDNEEAAGIEECIQLDVAMRREMEKFGITAAAQAHADKYPMIPA